MVRKLFSESFRMALLMAAVSVTAFLLIAKAPIDPVVSYVGADSTLSEEAKEEIEEYWGLNDSLPERFLTWASHVVQGDFGISITYKKPVLEVITTRFSYSFVLMLFAWIFSGAVGFFLGILCGFYQGSVGDRMVKSICLILKSSPTFWVGLLMLTIFSVQLGWFPTGMAAPVGKLADEVTLGDRLYHLTLPALTLSFVSMGDMALFTRQKTVEIMNRDFILYARARGESKAQILKRHVLRNVALPAVTVQFSSFGELFGGMALAENVFSYPGIGTAITAAALNGDAPLLMGIALFSALFVFTGNLTANLLYSVLDPRIREGEDYV